MSYTHSMTTNHPERTKAMNIGTEKPARIVEPIKNPVPERVPQEAPARKAPPRRTPAPKREPAKKPERV